MGEKKLAYSVFLRETGRTYPAGATADQIGSAAEKIGAHAWEGAEAEDESTVGVPLGRRAAETPSGLPGGDVTTTVPIVTGGDAEVDQETLEARLTPSATVSDGMGGDATSPAPGRTGEEDTTTGADSGTDADADAGSGSGASTPAKRTAPAKRTGSRAGSGS